MVLRSASDYERDFTQRQLREIIIHGRGGSIPRFTGGRITRKVDMIAILMKWDRRHLEDVDTAYEASLIKYHGPTAVASKRLAKKDGNDEVAKAPMEPKLPKPPIPRELKRLIVAKYWEWLEANKQERAEISDPIEEALWQLELQARSINHQEFKEFKLGERGYAWEGW